MSNVAGTIISLNDIDTAFDDEPRVADERIAEALGFGAPRQIRELIKRNIIELQSYGSLSCRTTMIEIGKGGRRAVDQYFLNEAQAVLVCMFSRTTRAAEARKSIIQVFMAYRRAPMKALPPSVVPSKAALTPRTRAALYRQMEAAIIDLTNRMDAFESAVCTRRNPPMLAKDVQIELPIRRKRRA